MLLLVALDWIREAIMATDRTLIPDRHAKLSRAVLTRDTEDVLNNRRLQPDVSPLYLFNYI